jgi:hypothetical protein
MTGDSGMVAVNGAVVQRLGFAMPERFREVPNGIQ